MMVPDSQTRALDQARQAIDDMIEPASEQFREMTQTAVRWLLSTFLALNSGGIVTAFTQASNLVHPLLVAAIFFAGLLAALASASSVPFAVQAYLSSLRNLQKDAETWSDDTTSETLAGAAKSLRGAVWAFLWPAAFGFASGLAFLIGAGTFTLDQRAVDASNLRRCEAIQRDMLSARPRRPDGPDLFQALGCRPQGEGSVYAAPTPKGR